MTPNTEASFHLIPASRFTLQELTAAYNQTRVDYMIPMPMDAARLGEYLRVYDVDLSRSWVALESAGEAPAGEAPVGEAPVGEAPAGETPAGETPGPEPVLGLAMLGVRPGRAWVTRLGVESAARQHGVGERLVRALLKSAAEAGCPLVILEVILGNRAAHSLFQKLGFVETRPLLVLHRDAAPPVSPPAGSAEWLEGHTAIDLLGGIPTRLPWTNEVETFQRAGDARGLAVRLPSGASGWMVFRAHAGLLSHFVLHTNRGSPEAVCAALLGHLYYRYPDLDSSVENVPVDDPHAAELARQGFRERFRRMEMVRRA